MLSRHTSTGHRPVRLTRAPRLLTLVLAASWCASLGLSPAWGDAWPTYLHDQARSGITPERLDPPLVPVWTFRPLVPPDPAWSQPLKEQARVRFDDAFHVAVADDRVYFGSSGDHHVYALDATTGTILWTFATDGPVRLAPSIAGDAIYFGSDDGFVYCLDAVSGSLRWKQRVADGDDRVIGHGRVISLWPVRSGVLVDSGVAYCAAGVFPAESIYVAAYDARTGERIWRNDVAGERGPEQQYDGISPQGYLLASQTTLYVPAGRSMPAAFDRRDGSFLFYLKPGGKVGGTYALLTGEHLIAGINEQRIYDAQSGRTIAGGYAWSPAQRLIVSGNISYALSDHDIQAIDRTTYPEIAEKRKELVNQRQTLENSARQLYRERYVLKPDDPAYQQKHDELTAQIDAMAAKLQEIADKLVEIERDSYLWSYPNDCRDAMILAGGVMFVGGPDRVVAVDAEEGRWLWSGTVTGRASGLAVADGRLFASTTEGTIHCFQGGAPTFVDDRIQPERRANPYPDDELTPLYRRAVEQILADSGAQRGFCLVLGAVRGRLAYELARRTELKVYGLSADEADVAAARELLTAAGVYGSRVTIEQGDFSRLPYPDYCANLIVSEDVLLGRTLAAPADEVYRVLRPRGGVLALGQPALGEIGLTTPAAGQKPLAAVDRQQLSAWIAEAGADAQVTGDGGTWLTLSRGALPGAGQWTHLYGNPSNTSNSGDQNVKTPLGVLWFGNPGPERMIERHARAAGPLAFEGRLFVQGENVLMAYDAYNGTLLWEREIPGALRVRADVDGSNLAVTARGLMVATRDRALRLDPATGETLAEYRVPDALERPVRWGMLASVDDVLLGTSTAPLNEEYGARWQNPSADPHDNAKAYHQFHTNGGLWRNMMRWPDWGREDHWRGGMTGKMITGHLLFALDVESGETRWSYEGAVCPTAVTLGNGVVFLTDHQVSDEERAAAVATRQAQYGMLFDEKSDGSDLKFYDVRRFLALDMNTGEKLWERVVDVTGSGGDKLGLAYEQGMLLVFGHFSNHDGPQWQKGGLAWRRVSVLSAEDGGDLWSKELNYLRRPFVMGSQLIVEPRACDLRTGEWKMRVHPVTGEAVPWEFKRGGHSCGVCTASEDTFFLRSDSINYYDIERDHGMLPIGGTRAGCWINMITADGLALMPEASSGCTCSFPIRSTIVLAPQERDRTWSIYVSPGELQPVQHWCINLGAPGDRKDERGQVWFSYPRLDVPYGVKFNLHEEIAEGGGGFFAFAPERVAISGSQPDRSWVYASGATGLVRLRLPLIESGPAARYTVRLGFADPVHETAGRRVFDIKLQGRTVAEGFDIAAQAGGAHTIVIHEESGVEVADWLEIELLPSAGELTPDTAPLLNSVEVIRE